jgi:hypothetical protein
LTSGPAAAQAITTVPTLIILDGAGVRRGAWGGRLTPAQEAEVLAAIKKLTRVVPF